MSPLLLKLFTKMKKKLNTIISLLKRFFTPVNLSKIIVIFLVGFTSRFLINNFLGINVFTEYLTLVSITFYSGFAAFIVFVHEFFSYFNVSIIPNFVWSTCSRIGLALDFLFIKPFVWVYSRTWGKNIHVLHMNDTRNSNASIYIGNEQNHYSYERSYNINSYYNRVAQQNSYQVKYSSVNRIPHPSHYPPEQYNYESVGYNDEYVDHNTSQNYNTTHSDTQRDYSYQEEDSSRFFRIDTIEQDGVDRSFYTPINQPNAPRMSNNTTPRTMTPLFGSTEQLGQNSNRVSEASSAYTNDTTHATIGPNRSESYINWPARGHNLFRAMEVEAQFLKKEIPIPSSQVKGEVSLGVRYIDQKSGFSFESTDKKSNIQSLYVKYHDLTKRKFFWNIWEKNRGDYSSYQDFKLNFDPKMNIWTEIAKTIKSDLSKEIHDLLKSDPFGTKRPTVTTRDIRRVKYSSTQDRLNHINSRRYKATNLPRDLNH